MFITYLGFHGGSGGKESACNVRDLGSIPGLGRSPGEGNSFPLQYSGLENWMDRGAWRAIVHGLAKSQTQMRDWQFQFTYTFLLMFIPYSSVIWELSLIYPLFFDIFVFFLFGRTMWLTITMKTIKPLVIKLTAIFKFYEEKTTRKEIKWHVTFLSRKC